MASSYRAVDSFVQELLKQGGLGLFAAGMALWGYTENRGREKDRERHAAQMTKEREEARSVLEKERAELKQAHAEVLRLATESASTNAVNRATLVDLKDALGELKGKR